MKNYYFEVGEKYKCDVSDDIIEVANMYRENGKVYVVFENVKTEQTSRVELRTAQELLITKI